MGCSDAANASPSTPRLDLPSARGAMHARLRAGVRQCLAALPPLPRGEASPLQCGCWWEYALAPPSGELSPKVTERAEHGIAPYIPLSVNA